MQRFRRLSVILVAVVLAGTLASASVMAADGRVVAAATGGGGYLIGDLQVSFSFNAIGRQGGSATGRLFHSVVLGGQLIEFEGRVTCVTTDPENRRAWIGGVITANNSEHPGFLNTQHEVGRDIWFRVLDNGEGNAAEADRSTFVGFEGSAGIITSEEYCTSQPWPDGNARTSPLNRGNLKVHG
ncbi:hypothetical protein BH24CHL6_BH24CHL6_04740 [soil metagenome]